MSLLNPNFMNKKLIVLIAFIAILLGATLALQVTPWGTAWIWNLSNEGTWLFPLVGVAALIDSINPCAFSILLLTIAFLLTLGRTRSSILTIGGAYIVGLFFTYILIGLGIFQVLHLFNTPHFMARVGAIMLIVLGVLHLLNVLFPRFPLKIRLPQSLHQKMAGLMEKASIPTAFVLGALVGLCEFPCTGGPYLMVIGLLHDQSTYFKGLGYLLYYNLIFILPLVILMLIASNAGLLEKVQVWKRENLKGLKFWSGIAMILLGLLIFIL